VAVVTNAGDIPVAGVPVQFAVTGGGGTLSDTQSTTDSQGVVSTRWTLGSSTYTHTVTATTAGVTGSPLMFTAHTSCTFELSPIYANFSSAPATGAVNVTPAPSDCPWTAMTPEGSFVTITGGSSGTGAGTVQYSVGTNTGPTSRSTTLTIAGKSFVVTQGAAGASQITLNASASPGRADLAWTATAGASSYSVRRSSNGGAFAEIMVTTNPAHADMNASNGTGYLYQVVALSGTQTALAYSNVDLAVPFAYTDLSLAAGTVIKAVHVAQLQQAVNAARAALGWSAVAYSGSVAPGAIVTRGQFVELRSTVDSVRAALGLPPPSYTDPAIVAGSTKIRAPHINDLREGLR
jgi:hypothetical protein